MGKEASSRANTSISPNTEKLESYQLPGRNKHWKINTFTPGTQQASRAQETQHSTTAACWGDRCASSPRRGTRRGQGAVCVCLCAPAGASVSWEGEARFARRCPEADIWSNSGTESESHSPSNFAPSAPPPSCLPSTCQPGQSLEKHRQKQKKNWQLKVERALLCSTTLNSLGNTTQLSGIGMAFFSCQKRN